jgi:hypothetical protein
MGRAAQNQAAGFRVEQDAAIGRRHARAARYGGSSMIAIRWIAIGLLGWAPLLAQQLPFEPSHDSGQSITGAFEGWFPNADGSFNLLLGYFNRNLKQELEIPSGPNNLI